MTPNLDLKRQPDESLVEYRKRMTSISVYCCKQICLLDPSTPRDPDEWIVKRFSKQQIRFHRKKYRANMCSFHVIDEILRRRREGLVEDARGDDWRPEAQWTDGAEDEEEA